MGAARIAGCAVQVAEEKYTHGSVEYSKYTVSGEGAARLHAFCEEIGLKPGPLHNGQFIYDSANYDHFTSTPNKEAVAGGLKRAASQIQLG